MAFFVRCVYKQFNHIHFTLVKIRPGTATLLTEETTKMFYFLDMPAHRYRTDPKI